MTAKSNATNYNMHELRNNISQTVNELHRISKQWFKRWNHRFEYIISILTRHQQMNAAVPDFKQNCHRLDSILIFSA
jgi:hypothetical protein